MHSVAKFVTKAFPVSGILDNLTEVEWMQLNIFRVRIAAEKYFRQVMSVRFEVFFFLSIGPSRQHSSWRKDKSTDGVGLLGEDSSDWNKSEFLAAFLHKGIIQPVVKYSH